MPQCDVFYSDDVEMDFEPMFQAMENKLNEQDPSASLCKSRAFKSDRFLHTSVLIRVALLPKSHRDQAFMQQCLENMEHVVKPFVPEGVYYAVELVFSSEYYLTLKK